MYLKLALRAVKHFFMRIFTPNALNGYERSEFSQNGEDGIVREVFRRIGTTNRFFVEFGVEDGLECITARLARRERWSGVMIEGSPQNFAALDANYRAFPDVKRIEAFITRENIADLFSAAGVPSEFDLLSIDIDGNDYWVWEALAAYHPRMIVIEYNATRPPPERWVMAYNPAHEWKRDGYMGASLASLEALGTRLGYALIGTDEKGVNAFFLREDVLAAGRFPRLDAAAAFHPTDYGFQPADGAFEAI
jgi:hypothetical protein